ncbi:ictacalcin-like [Trachinotus anak]|uniref:ictacalcin-like n=1 Tax=Trachinotus anak TaxID=443729 RepID=UPI0039F1F05F
MARLGSAMASLVTVFNEYAGKEGDKKTLTRAELIELLHNEFPGAGDSNKAAMDKFFTSLDENMDGVVDFKEYVTFDSNKAEVDEFFSMLDGDKDGVVDFKEYVTFVTALTVLCN